MAGLVDIAALAPDADETSQSLQSKLPTTEVFDHIEVAEGRVWLRPSGTQLGIDAPAAPRPPVGGELLELCLEGRRRQNGMAS